MKAVMLGAVVVAAFSASVVDGRATLMGGPKVLKTPLLRSAATNATKAQALTMSSASTNFTRTGKPCQCVATDPAWKSNYRTAPKCVFIDLGAANGNTLQQFLQGGYGPVSNCPGGGAWEAWLVEANPRFKQDMDTISAKYPGNVHPLSSTAAYMCEAQTNFFLDTQNHQANYWGSSMSSTHPDAQKSGLTKVLVNTVNLMRVLHENTIPGDYVMVKMDIEGSEWDVLPCLAQSPDASLVDILYVETHPASWQLGDGPTATTQAQLDWALAALRAKHINIPAYNSPTL